ncbi:EthD domain-containing protein [Paraburkholderia sacchari]|uniref:EthD domain-containing protein n=1 Tax=Paraburkholderia sacchari TaxID=159450 RepID=UPI0039A58F48
MFTAVILMKRKDGTTREEFLDYYRDRHGPLMVTLMKDKGLVSYEHFPLNLDAYPGLHLSPEAKEWDAVSIYTYESQQKCEECWSIPEVIVDSQNFMNQTTMITIPVDRRMVFP